MKGMQRDRKERRILENHFQTYLKKITNWTSLEERQENFALQQLGFVKKGFRALQHFDAESKKILSWKQFNIPDDQK